MEKRLEGKVGIVTGGGTGIGRGGGSLVFVGSVHGYMGGSDVLAYASAKGGLWTMTRNLARTFARDKITVNYINPGWVASKGEVVHRRELGYPDESTPRRAPAASPSCNGRDRR